MTHPIAPADLADSIAIVGLAGRFPGARNVDEFWRNLAAGVESIAHLDESDFPGVDPALLQHPQFVKAKGVLDDIESFDAGFFGYTPPEARAMDPQHRIFLECGWTALEDAGYAPETYAGAIGVFAGLSLNSYLLMNLHAHPEVGASLGTDKDFLSTRLSYKLNLKGPSIVVQTACSTSLVAVCQACQALLAYQCDIALAGGVTATVPRKAGYWYQEGGILSPDGHCRAFDASANGTVPGNGVGIVVLKRFADAVADGDTIRAVIRGFAVNNDGALKIGYTAPSIQGQSQVITTAQALAGVDPDSISYVETHGTGTTLGDPIEIAALTEAFRAGTDKRQFCAIGSVKTNIGHLDVAAGIAGLIKTVLALQRKQIPPSLHFERPNPKIDFADSPFHVNTQLTEWRTGGTPRRAGVSSFGIGGTNAHVVLEEAPALAATPAAEGWHMLTISARSEAALDIATRQLAAQMGSEGTRLADVAYTLHVGRKRFPYGRAVVCRSLDEARSALESGESARIFSGRNDGTEPQVVFMFPGQGAQYPGMGGALYAADASFRARVDECGSRLGATLGFDVREVLCAPADDERAAERLSGTRVTQAALFVVEYALARMWMDWGVRPAALIGHSVGEYVAACLAGVLPLDDALRLVLLRGELMERATDGAMVAVPLSEAKLADKLPAGVSLAAVNGPGMCVVAGERSRIEQFEEHLRDEAITYQRLRTAGAFHSELMDGVVAPLVDAARTARLGTPAIPYISNVTGTWMRDADALDAAYWGRHARMPVRFGAGVEALARWGAGVFLEVGPGQSLGALVRLHDRAGAAPLVPVRSLRHPREEMADEEAIHRALGRLWLAGVTLDWSAYHASRPGRRVPLPTYPFERKRYWFEPSASQPPAQTTLRDVASAPAPAAVSGVAFAIPSWSRSFTTPLRADRAEAPQRFLAFVDGPDHAWLSERLERRGHAIVRVRPGREFARVSESEFVVNPTSRTDYDALLTALCASNLLPDRVLHLWLVTNGAGAPANDAVVALAHGFYSVLRLAQAWSDAQPARSLPIAIVADGVHDVTGADDICPEKAAVIGPCRVLPHENGRLSFGLIDVARREFRAESLIANRVLGEIEAPALTPMVAMRGLDRLVPALEPVSLDGQPAPTRLRERGVYLITGGYGAIGLAIARYLANAVQARIVLVGRSGLPERDRWQRHVAIYKVDDEVSQAIRAIQQLEEEGAEVMTERADVASEPQLRGVVERVLARFGRLDGVIHAAGMAGGGVAQLRDDAAIDAVMRPKVAGPRVLDEVLRDVPLDFMVLCSSMTALTGGAGQVDYCAANACLDAFARWRTRRGALTVAINWDTWREGGMAVRARVDAEALARGLSHAEALDAFARCLASELPQVVVARQTSRTSQPRVDDVEDRVAVDVSAQESLLNPRPDLGTTFVGPQDEVQQRICDVWQETLGIERIGVHDSFFDLGGHSLHAIQVVARLNADFGTAIPVARLFEGLTPAYLADVVRGSRGESSTSTTTVEIREDRHARQRQHQERRRVARTGQGRIAQ